MNLISQRNGVVNASSSSLSVLQLLDILCAVAAILMYVSKGENIVNWLQELNIYSLLLCFNSGQSSWISIQSSMKYWRLSKCLWKMWVLNHMKVTKPLVMWNDDIELGVSGGKCAAHLSHDNNNNSLTPTPHGTGCRPLGTGCGHTAQHGTGQCSTLQRKQSWYVICDVAVEQRRDLSLSLILILWPWGRGQVRVRKARKGELSFARLQRFRSIEQG